MKWNKNLGVTIVSTHNQFKSGAFTLEFKRELPQDAGEKADDMMSKEMWR